MSDCGLCVGGNADYEIIDYQWGFRDAAEPIPCCECNREIAAGATYEHVTGVNEEDGEDVELKTCLDCANIALGLSCNGRAHGMLWSDLEDSEGFEGFSEACVAKVESVSAKRYLRDRWLKWKGLAK
jgi:hypothetical protein